MIEMMKKKIFVSMVGVGLWLSLSGMAWAHDLLWSRDGVQTDERFGTSVGRVGDVDGDGVPEVVIGAYGYDGAGGINCGRVCLCSGDTGRVIRAWNGEHAHDHFGSAVVGAGDVDADGIPDVIVGASGCDGPGGVQCGKAYVYSGRTGQLLWSWLGEATYDYFGQSVSGAGDVNGDGRADLVVGASWHDSLAGVDSGKVYLFSGATGQVLRTWSGSGYAFYFGKSVSGAGDVDRDGFDDVIIGSDSGIIGGKAYVYSGATGLLIWSWSPGAGSFVSGIGDVDRDGHADLLIGGSGPGDPGGPNAGRAFVYSGASGLQLWAWNGEAAWSNFGTSVSGAGDVNGDGVPDLIIGAQTYGGDNRGKAYLFSGRSGVLLGSWEGDVREGYFGSSVSAVGDVDRDGKAEVIISAPLRGGVGRVCVYRGWSEISILSIVPDRGSYQGGDVVLISGSGFVADVTVSFGGAQSTEVTVLDSSHLLAVTPRHDMPPGSEAVDVTVTSTLGSATLPGGFTYEKLPVIRSRRVGE